MVVARSSATSARRSRCPALAQAVNRAVESNGLAALTRLRFIPTPPWQHVLRRACEVCFGGLWVRFTPLANGVPSWRPSHASYKKRSRTAPGRVSALTRAVG